MSCWSAPVLPRSITSIGELDKHTPPRSRLPLREGMLIEGRYLLEQRLGEGSSSSVFAAEDLDLGFEVALKFLTWTSTVGRLRFHRELNLLRTVPHDAIVTARDSGRHLGMEYFVMERVQGPNLERWLQDSPEPMPFRRACRLVGGIARALAAVHSRRLLHRDIKPANLLLETTAAGERLRLIDFGLALPGEAPRITGEHMTIGTPRYMAPERWQGKARPAGDVFSLGVCLYELVSRRTPFVGLSPMEVARAVMSGRRPILSEAVPSAPVGLDLLVQEMLAPNPAERPNAAQVARRLGELSG